jgi:hypothetical protein
MALHFTLVGESELSIHFDIDGLAELLRAVEGSIRAAKEHARSGAPDAVPLTVASDLPTALRKVTLTMLETTAPVIH